MLESDRTYPVPKSQLLAKLRENREIHVKEYTEAKEGFRQAAITVLSTELAKARDNLDFDISFLDLQVPRSYASEYDKAIGLLEMTTDETIDINSLDYTRYVLDEWHWKSEFQATSADYLGKSRRGSDKWPR